MNYCSIDDAWKDFNYISDQYRINDNPFNNNSNNQPVNESFGNTNVVQDTHFTNNNITCDMFIYHLESCPMCREKMISLYSSKLLTFIQQFVQNNKDNILIVLIVLFGLIFLKLLLSIISG